MVKNELAAGALLRTLLRSLQRSQDPQLH